MTDTEQPQLAYSPKDRQMFPSFQSICIPNGKKRLASLLCIASAAIATPLHASAQAGIQKAMTENTGHLATNSGARRYLDTLAVAAQARTDQALCAALVSAEQAQQSLGSDLQRQRDTIFAQSPSDSAALERLEHCATEAVDRLPGIGLSVGAETVYHYVRYGALASYAAPGSASARALRRFGDIWSDPAGLAVFFEPSTDISGCQRPASLVPILRDLAALWASVAPCLKSALRPKLMAGVEELMNGTCYCGDETETVSTLQEIAVLITVFADSSSVAAAAPSFAPGQQAASHYLCR